jgi:hypothetical protein
MTAATAVYLLGIVALLVTMGMRKNVAVPAIVATFLTALIFSGDVVSAIMAVFRASVTAGSALLDLFMVIAVMVSMMTALRSIGADTRMVTPFTKVMRNGITAFATLIAVTYVLALFFWPTPSLALVGALLLPAAVRVGLPPLACGIAIALAGQGMAIASDYVIGVGPAITASGGTNMPAEGVAGYSLVVSWLIGAVAIILSYVLTVRPMIKRARGSLLAGAALTETDTSPFSAGFLLDETVVDDATGRDKPRLARFWAAAVPLVFLAVLVYMLLGRFTDLVPWEDGGGAAFVGGTALLIMLSVVASDKGRAALQDSATHYVDGMSYAFKAMGIMIPIAGFFYIGNPDYSVQILGLAKDATPPKFLFDIVDAIEPAIPNNAILLSLSMVVIGMITALDGSGWAGLPLIGGLSSELAGHAGMNPVVLAAVGQNAAVWTGGGTLLTWSSLIAVASFARVPVIDLVRAMFIPVVTGLVVAAVTIGILA